MIKDPNASDPGNPAMKLCVYCQINPATTMDHVPPKGIFPKPRPGNLITVPACEPCNGGFKNDDEYFLLMALEWNAAETKDGEKIAEGRLRDMDSVERRGLWRGVAAWMRPIEVYTAGGLYMGQSVEFKPDTDRMRRTLNRIIRGLYAAKVGPTPLPPSAMVASMTYSQYAKDSANDPGTQRIIEGIQGLPVNKIGEDAFQYRFFLLDPATFVSIWYLEFYRRHAFVGTTSAGGHAGVAAEGQAPIA
jgi:hypothetical protein